MKDSCRFTLEEKVGQLFFLGFQGIQPDADTIALFDRVRPGGLIFLNRNIESFDQARSLTDQLGSAGVTRLLAVAHEGGPVDRLKQIFAPIPPLSQLGRAGTNLFRVGARIIATQLETVGFNVNFAPVLDLGCPGSVMTDRTLSANPVEVSRLGSLFIDELHKREIVACVKHFPGMGAAHVDPHFALPRVDRAKRRLLQEDAAPFVNLLRNLRMITISHAHYPALGEDKPVPASLSPRIVEGLLRKKFGFAGVIVSDDLTMGAISSLGLTPDVFLRAFEAGNDMLLFSQSTPLVEQAFKGIVRAVRGSELLRKRLDESVGRIMALKSRIQYVPIHHRAHAKSRILRQIERLHGSLAQHVPQSVLHAQN